MPAADGEPKMKRQRTAVACDSCRSRKTRCNGARPTCSVCGDMGFSCVYTRPARVASSAGAEAENTSPIEERLRALEGMLRAVISKTRSGDQGREASLGREQEPISPSSSTNISARASDNRHQGGAALNQTHNVELGMLTQGKPGILTNSGTLNHTGGDTVDGMGVITFSDEVTSGYFGPTSNSEFFSHISKAVSQAGQSRMSQLSIPSINNADTSYISRPPSPPASHRDNSSLPSKPDAVDCFVLPPEATILRLVDMFFSGTGLLFPYIYKKSVLDGLIDIRMGRNGVRRTWLCLLNIIMAFATCVTGTSEVRRENCTADTDDFLQRALQLLPNIALAPANLEAFQALILVAQYLQGTQHSAQTWNLQGLTVQAAFQIGVHSSASGAKFSPLEQEIRKRCWCMCFILDKTCSMTFGRPPSIPNTYLQAELPFEIELEALDTSITRSVDPALEPCASTVAAFTQTIKLYELVADIMEKVFQNNFGSDKSISCSSLFQQIISIEPRLATWKAKLPEYLRVQTKEDVRQNSQEASIFHPLRTVITLRYLCARVLLHRPMVARFLDHDGMKEGASEEWSFLLDFGRTSLEIGVRSAAEMIEIIYTSFACRHHMLTTWWFSIYYLFSSALVIFAAILVKHKHGIQIASFEFDNGTASLQRALETLENLGDDTRIAMRCRKYLKKLVHVACSISTAPHYYDGMETQIGAQQFDRMDLPGADFSDFIPQDMDLVPFGIGGDSNIFTQSLDLEFLHMPFQMETVQIHQAL